MSWSDDDKKQRETTIENPTNQIHSTKIPTPTLCILCHTLHPAGNMGSIKKRNRWACDPPHLTTKHTSGSDAVRGESTSPRASPAQHALLAPSWNGYMLREKTWTQIVYEVRTAINTNATRKPRCTCLTVSKRGKSIRGPLLHYHHYRRTGWTDDRCPFPLSPR